MKLKQFKNKKILILGFGREGEDSYLALRKLFPDKILGIADELRIKNIELRIKNKKNKFYFGKDYLKAVKEYDVIIKTPGIPQSKIKPFLKKGSILTSQTEIFFDNFKGTVIGVTGTKGKGTTSSLIYSILKKADVKSKLVGNIGRPVLMELLKTKNRGYGEIFVYELSSHQLQGLKKSPHIAVFLNLFRDHLDYYKTEKEYQKAKQNITKFQGAEDWLIFNADDKKVKQIAKTTKAKTISFSEKDKTYLQSIIQDKDIPLTGEFNKLNILAGVRVGEILGISKKKIKQGIMSFRGLPCRLEFVGKYKGIEFYDDSMATIPEVTIAALKAFKGRTATLIVGGSEKGSDYKELAKAILNYKVKTLIILTPGVGKKIWNEYKKWFKLGRSSQFEPGKKMKKIEASSMQEAVRAAYRATNTGGICLMAPGAASFNLFSSYKERGDLFKKWVKYYGKKK